MKNVTKKKKTKAAQSPDEIGALLGLGESDIALMKYKAEISKIAVKAMEDSGLTVNELVERSGVARSKVSAVKNGATVSVSIDLLLRIIAATGIKLTIRAA